MIHNNIEELYGRLIKLANKTDSLANIEDKLNTVIEDINSFDEVIGTAIYIKGYDKNRPTLISSSDFFRSNNIPEYIICNNVFDEVKTYTVLSPKESLTKEYSRPS